MAVGFEDDPIVRVDADRLLLQRGDALASGRRSTTVSATPEQSVDGARRLATIEWDPARTRLVTDDPAATDVAFDRAVARVSAPSCWVWPTTCLAVTVDYVQEREQFGRPIGSYQALKHKLADVLMALDFARPMVARAAYSLAHDDPSASVHVSMAKAYASQAGLTAASACPPVPRRHRLHRRVRPAHVDEAGLGAGRPVGRRRLAPPPGRRRDPLT